VLRDGDLVTVGRTIFKFLSGSNIERSYHEEIYRLTTTDGLTQIYNRRFLMETLEQEISRSRRYRRELAVLLFDVDHFKAVNDTHGHIAGDHVLKNLANVVRARIRREDVLGRYGGEEFLIILPEINLPSARLLGEKIRDIVARSPFRFEETPIAVTVSVGVAGLEANQKGDDLIKVVDARLLEAKAGGRNCVRG
jgi:diguanylate cyclase (GGDEF)-like protein